MRNVTIFTLLVLSSLMSVGSSVGQQRPPASVSQLSEQGLATVYVYRLDEDGVVTNFFFWFIKTRPVYFGERLGAGRKVKKREIAALRNKQYFMVRLPAGKYTFDTRSMWGQLEIDVVAGGKYYLWVDQGSDCPSEDPSTIGPPTCEGRNASIVSVSPEKWGRSMSALKPIRSGDVKDRRLVIIPPGPPSNTSLDRSGGSVFLNLMVRRRLRGDAPPGQL